MSRMSFGSPLRPKIQSAKRFLSLQVSQASHVISDELSSILKSKLSGKKRRRIIDEIFSTEQSYQEHLHLVTTLFLSPLREMDLLPEHVVSLIFSNIEAIENVNRELLTHMETMGIGDAFLALAPFLRLYSTYANNFEKAINTIKDWEKKCPKFSSFKKKQESLEEAKGLKLNALLITPIQRVPRYKMLLENLLWKTPKEHADFDKLKEAVEQISNVAIHINENIRQHENFQKMLSIQNSFSREGAPKILAPGRNFLKEGTLLKVGKRGWGSSKERTFFLFSDILIYAKKNNAREKEAARTYLCLHVFPLLHCKVQEVMGDGNACSEGGALFSVEYQDKCLLLFSKSQGEAKSWLNEIRTAIDAVHESKSSLRRSTRAGCSSRMTKRRAPVRKTNERRLDVNSNRTSSLKKITSQLDCLSPRKNKELIVFEDEPSELPHHELQNRDESDSTNEDQHLEDASKKINFSCSESPSKNFPLKCEKENAEPKCENVNNSEDLEISCQNDSSQSSKQSIENIHKAGVKRKVDDCTISDETSEFDRPDSKRKSIRVAGWLLNCGSSLHGPT